MENRSSFRHAVRILLAALFTAVTALVAGTASGASPASINAFVLEQIPDDPARLEKLFSELKKGGANTVIIQAGPGTAAADRTYLADFVSSAHKASLKVFIIHPVRNLPLVVKERSEWEDMRYDLKSGTIQPTGMLNLFRDDVVEYLSVMFKDLAATSVDGILFGTDFSYGDVEGMTRNALELYKDRHNAALIPGKAFSRVVSGPEGPSVAEYGGGFKEWAELKRDRLMEVAQRIMVDVRAEQAQVRFGLPLHLKGLESPEEALNRFGYDMAAFKSLNVDLYWVSIPHRDIRKEQGLGYKESMEVLSRAAQAALAAVGEPGKTLIVFQTASAAGRVLPYSEIEKTVSLARKTGKPVVAFTTMEDRLLPTVLTKKLFRGKDSGK